MAAYDRVEFFLLQRPYLRVVEANSAIARKAAELRASSGLSATDAIIVATAINAGCDAIIGNDAMLRSRNIGISYLHLNDFAVRS